MVNEKQIHLGVRVPRHIDALLKDVCQRRGEDVSDFIRREIYIGLAKLSYLSEEDMRALGMKTTRRKQKQAVESH